MVSAPCTTCPWRKTSTVGGDDIPRFDLDRMRGLLGTVGENDAFRPIMACHHSPDGDEFACAGYLAVEGMSNLNVRVLAAVGSIDMLAVYEAADGLDLWGDFESMLAAYERAHDAA